jgi:hypothetical protein
MAVQGSVCVLKGRVPLPFCRLQTVDKSEQKLLEQVSYPGTRLYVYILPESCDHEALEIRTPGTPADPFPVDPSFITPYPNQSINLNPNPKLSHHEQQRCSTTWSR